MLFETNSDDSGEWKPPSYKKKGRILVRIEEKTGAYNYDYEVLEYDGDSSIHWINEGMGFEYWFDEYCDFPALGTYVIEGVHGMYFLGDGWTTDDDEEWYFDVLRPATDEEIHTESLSNV